MIEFNLEQLGILLSTVGSVVASADMLGESRLDAIEASGFSILEKLPRLSWGGRSLWKPRAEKQTFGESLVLYSIQFLIPCLLLGGSFIGLRLITLVSSDIHKDPVAILVVFLCVLPLLAYNYRIFVLPIILPVFGIGLMAAWLIFLTVRLLSVPLAIGFWLKKKYSLPSAIRPIGLITLTIGSAFLYLSTKH